MVARATRATRARVRARPISLNRAAIVDTAIYDRYTLEPGAEFAGPAIVEERESTLIIGARGRAASMKDLNVVVELSDGN